jgi:hypothetical protein
LGCTLADLLPDDIVVAVNNVPNVETGGTYPAHRVRRWMRPTGGVFKIVLKSASLAGRRVTTVRWLAEFLKAVGEQRNLGATQGQHSGPFIGDAS